VREASAGDVHHRRALHRHQRSLLRRRLPGRLHPRVRAHPHHRPRSAPASPSARSRRSSRRTPCRKWEPFVKINYAYPDADPINSLVDEYARETTSTTRRSKHASRRRLLRRECSRRELDRRKRTGYSRRRPATREKTDDAFLTVRKLQARELRGLVQGLGARRMAGRRAKGVHPAQPVSRLERRLP
jgi:hypothetical protein